MRYNEDGFYYCTVCRNYDYYPHDPDCKKYPKTDDGQRFKDFKDDLVNHPKHYTTHPSGVECIDITEHWDYCLGNCLKYIWRHGEKGGVEDLKKARWYLNREIKRLGGGE